MKLNSRNGLACVVNGWRNVLKQILKEIIWKKNCIKNFGCLDLNPCVDGANYLEL